jgi:hypothetical protein
MSSYQYSMTYPLVFDKIAHWFVAKEFSLYYENPSRTDLTIYISGGGRRRRGGGGGGGDTNITIHCQKIVMQDMPMSLRNKRNTVWPIPEFFFVKLVAPDHSPEKELSVRNRRSFLTVRNS